MHVSPYCSWGRWGAPVWAQGGWFVFLTRITNKACGMDNVREPLLCFCCVFHWHSVFPFKKKTCYNWMSMKETLLSLHTVLTNKREKENETCGELVHFSIYMLGLLPLLARAVDLWKRCCQVAHSLKCTKKRRPSSLSKSYIFQK